MKKEIKLEDILLSEIINSKLNNLPDFSSKKKKIVINAMKEACKQVLDLATENATFKVSIKNGKDIIGNFSHYIPDFDSEFIEINEGSILNTINQIKL